jgi:hypothetical protein
MDFSNVKLLTYEHKNNFWGDKSFRYGSTISMSINGYILDLANTSGVKDIFNACKNLSDSLGVYQDIVIDGVNYGMGKITSVSFDSGNWVKVTEYTASIEIIGQGNLGAINYTDSDFSNSIINGIKSKAEYLEEFNESYSIDYSSNEDGVSGTHSIDIKISSLFTGNKIEFAKNLASFLFSKTFSENLSKLSYSKPPENSRKDLYSETYDSINGSCGFRRNFSYSNTSDCFSVDRSVAVNLGQDGFTTVTESNTIIGECLSPTVFDSAFKAFSSQITDCYSRCNSAYNTYKSNFSIQGDLINEEMERSVTKNRFTGEIQYSVTFTNDKRVKNNYIYEYTLDLSRSEDFIWNASESGSITGRGVLGSEEKFKKAFSGWSAEKGAITSRVGSFYSANAEIKPSGSQLKLINKSTTHQPFDGVVSYSWSYTDDATLDMSNSIRRKSIQITDSKATRIHNDFLIPGGSVKYAIAQAANQSKQGEREVSANLEISSPTNPFVGNAFFDECVAIANANKGTGTDLYIDSFSFSSDEIEQNVDFSAKYKYSEAASNS